MTKLFGTDGIRGTAGSFPLNENTIHVIGSSVARIYQERLGRPARFITGRDTRESGGWIERVFHLGAYKENAVCESAGIITTPGVAFLTRQFDFDAGIVISASHNPFEDNGIKIFTPSGKKIDEETERLIEEDIFSSEKHELPRVKVEAEINRTEEFQTAYLNHVAEGFDSLRLVGLKIVIDAANGAASHLAPKLFTGFGADVAVINAEPDGRNINKDCGSLHLENLQTEVLKANADLGVAFDGDADRALFVDEKGEVIDGDGTLWMMAQHLLAKGKLENETVVATVMSNIGLEFALRSIGLKLLRTSVGDKYVLDELLITGSEIGGEQSGHIIFPEKSLVGDGMMTTLFLLEAHVNRGVSFSDMTKGFRRYPQILVNVRVKNKLPFESVEEIADASDRINKEQNGKGRLLLRYSGTENLARVMIEGNDLSVIEKQANELAKIIEKKLG